MICGKWIFNMIKDATGVMISRDKRNSASRMLLIRCYMFWRTKISIILIAAMLLR